MPVSIDAVAMKRQEAKTFRASEQYKEYCHDNLLFAEIGHQDGSALFLFNCNRSVDVSGLDLEDENHLHVTVDDEDDFGVHGTWVDHPFDFDVSCRMTLVVDQIKQKSMKYWIDQFDASVLENERLKEICEIYLKSGVDQMDDFEDEALLEEARSILRDRFEDLHDIACGTSQINFYREAGFDTSLSAKGTLIVQFTPKLKHLILRKDLLEDIMGWISEDGDFAASTFSKDNFELLEQIADRKGIDVGELLNFPSPVAYGMTGNMDGWMGGEDLLENLKQHPDVSLVSPAATAGGKGKRR